MWYDVYARCDGQDITVWRAQRGSGDEMTQVLNTSDAGTTGTAEFNIQPSGGSSYAFDNFQFVTDDISSTTTYSYDNANELLAMPTDGTNTTFTYDDWGRTITKAMSGHTGVHNWWYGDNLKDYQTTFPDETTVYYNYDGLGKRRNRLENTQSGPVTWWRWDLGYNVINEYTDSDTDWDIEGLTKTYVPNPRGHGMLAGIVGNDADTGAYGYLSHDRLGSVRRIRDGSQTSLGTYEYDPYGGQYAFSGLDLNQDFTGHMYEPDTGLYYAPYRYYSTNTARWLTRDPLRMVDGPNLYRYVRGNPVNNKDPLGLASSQLSSVG